MGRDPRTDSGADPRTDGGADVDPMLDPDTEQPPAQPPAARGEPCAAGDSPCVEGLECSAANGRCCVAGSDCCQVPVDCPDGYSDERGCSEPSTCSGTEERAVCSDNLCSSTFVASSDPSGCVGLQCAPAFCEAGRAGAASSCDALGACPEVTAAPCPNNLLCAGDECATTCVEGTTEGCRVGECENGACELRSIGESCEQGEQCLSGECLIEPPAIDGICSGAPGELCNPFKGPPCRTYNAPPAPRGQCWFGDREGATFRCHPPECTGRVCRYWVGDERSGHCDGDVQPFTTHVIGSPMMACYDDGGGMWPHERACNDGSDNDGDGSTDGDDLDCRPGSGDFWLNVFGRGPRALCDGGRCGAADFVGLAQCASGVGGCFDAACHSEVCWPNAGACAGLTAAETVCKWWSSVPDLDNNCDGDELIDRADDSWCGFGCTCQAGVASEHNCGDTHDNDRDDLIDGADPDCTRQHGDPCFAGSFNGSPDLGFNGVLMSGFNTGTDQCEGQSLCWCADLDCNAGVCLGTEADCRIANDFHCRYFSAPTATDCGSPSQRPNGSALLPTVPGFGSCSGGVRQALGTAMPGEACSAWHDCASGRCQCASADCQTRVCWAAGECGDNACMYRVSASECRPLAVGTPPIACGGGAIAEIDFAGKCVCGPGGAMLEVACDDGITNDWRNVFGGDTQADWYDPDCYFVNNGGAFPPYERSIMTRYGAP